jgi:hypothetical protein
MFFITVNAIANLVMISEAIAILGQERSHFIFRNKLGVAIAFALSYLKGSRLFWSVRNGFDCIYLNNWILYRSCLGTVLRPQNSQTDLVFSFHLENLREITLIQEIYADFLLG